MPAHVVYTFNHQRGYTSAQSGLSDRASGNGKNNDNHVSSQNLIIAAVVIAVLLCSALALYYVLRFFRARGSEPKFIPTTFLKKKWAEWMPQSEKRSRFRTLPTDRSASAQRSRAHSTTDTLNLISRPDTQGGRSNAEQNAQTEAGVDRNISVRSVITLPSYSTDARPTEQILGREGERSGVDTVIEFPETADEEEAHREDEMEALYQIRRARRQERQEREERRRLRREARARGDTATLRELRQQAQQARDNAAISSSEALVRENQSRGRERRVSSVSYMDLGVARHDGSRVRAASGDSDRRPLMESAAQMGGGEAVSSRSPSEDASHGRRHQHNRSASSLSRILTPDADISDDDRSSMEYEIVPTPPGRGSRATSMSNTIALPTLTTTRLRAATDQAGSTDESAAASGSAVTPNPRLPQYDDLSPRHDVAQMDVGDTVPAYESPSRSDAPRLPGFARLPSIRVTPFSPDVASELGDNWPASDHPS